MPTEKKAVKKKGLVVGRYERIPSHKQGTILGGIRASAVATSRRLPTLKYRVTFTPEGE